jgi:putative DNA-invertase from lambdoid prophage Rac
MRKGAVIIYTRISTANQSADSQLEELRAYCERRGWQDVQEITDCISGGATSRAGLDRLMGMVRRGRVGTIVAFKLDRLARSLAHLAQLIGELQSHGTALICPSQGIDTTDSNPVAHLQLNILGAVAQFEKDLIVERVNAGIRAAKQRGVTLGRPSKNAKHLPRVIELLRQNRCNQVIERELGLPRSSVGELVREARSMMQERV